MAPRSSASFRKIATGFSPLDDIRIMPGISTGAWQWLYMAVVLDAALDDERRKELLEDLYHRYSLVRNPSWFGPERDMRTYCDGGVRRSVFLAEALELVNELVESRANAAPFAPEELKFHASSIAPSIYVPRSGPTKRAPDVEPNKESAPKANALCAYDLIVNELEVGAIAGPRQIYPYGSMEIITADGFNGDFTGKPEHCEKKQETMFNSLTCIVRPQPLPTQKPMSITLSRIHTTLPLTGFVLVGVGVPGMQKLFAGASVRKAPS